MLTGYFKTLCNNVYNRIRVKNSKILELLIYSAYMEEQAKLKDNELSILYNDANYYYQEGQKEVFKSTNNKKKPSILEEALFLYLMQQANYNGYMFQQNIDIAIQYNAQQIYKQCLINISQGEENNIYNPIFQSIIKRQQDTKVKINENNITGNMDLIMIGINTKAKVEGIKLFNKNAKIKFIGINDNRQTDMCRSLNNQEFYINDWNEFERYSKSNDCIKKYKCFRISDWFKLSSNN